MLQLRETRMRLRQIEPQIRRLQNNQQQRNTRRRRKRICRNSRNTRESRPQRRPKRKRDTETCAHERHRPAALALITDIRCDRICQLYIPLAQSANNATGQERPEVRSGNPERDTEDVADH